METKTLNHDRNETFLEASDMLLRYSWKGEGRAVEILPLPAVKREKIVPRKRGRPSHPIFADGEVAAFSSDDLTDSMVQVAIRHLSTAGQWSAGRTMRNGEATQSLEFKEQTTEREPGWTRIRTTLSSPHGFEVTQIIEHPENGPGVFVRTSLKNLRSEPLPVEMLSSFSLSGITPFAEDDAPGRLRLHRFRSVWSNEAKHESIALEDLHLERTWASGPVSQRFGQVGSLPVRSFHPFIALEDTAEGVFWGAQIAWHGSWQMEVYRRDDSVCLSGGLGDFEDAHWMKEVAPGETFEAPLAIVTSSVGDIDDLCQRLVRMQDFISHPEPEHEKELPIIFNEWCSTWGNPTHDYIIRTADRLRETHTRYLVIDDGWAERPADESFQFNGDWNLNRKAFPHGIDKTTAAIRKRGLIPGIWFEFEACTEGTEAYSLTDHQLHLHGKVLQVGRRHFWDFRDPWTWEYLEEKVIRFLRENDFGYLKVDYNETIGIGCDGAESPGEGLRQHLIKVKEFFARIREQVPGIVIENCASGGHRGEPGMVALTSMSVFSDAHESVEIPIIAANQHRLTPARKNQVWAVLRPHDSIQRLYYSFAATFLGRMCISGDVMELPEATFSIVRRAQDFYVEAVPIIRDGLTRIIDRTGPSRRYPEGWQAVLRRHGGRILVVFHTFEFGEAGGGCPSVSIPLPADGHWEVSSYFGQFKMSGISGGKLIFADVEPFSGQALILARSH